ncbi:hypothetical protein [Aliikangiella sp. G2MR2-5]|uniref:hypothetical protein n=1 Tax=Aliikangiella sp. G2MR2-5 TaxID=2788943 RepID=UPI0018AB671B|nr:hypothetical protein [Aliikangiella sp. G2MR2-5]
MELLKSLLLPGQKLSCEQIEMLESIILLYIPWLLFFFLIRLFMWINNKARKRKTGAIVFALLTQIFLPDPKVEHTIKTVVIQKQKEAKKNQQNNSDMKADENN